MYTGFYGLQTKPFSQDYDPSLFFFSDQYQSASAFLNYAVLGQQGILLITGETGCGKTTLIHHFFNQRGCTSAVGFISNPIVLKQNVLRGMLFAFNVVTENQDDVTLYAKLHAFIRGQYQLQRTIILLVDEAQELKGETLDELRLLINSESGLSAAIQLILVGKPRLMNNLNLPEYSDTAQQIYAHFHLQALDEIETADYIYHRLTQAQCQRMLFTPTAVSRIYDYSGGNPRMINMLCDLALMYGYAENQPHITEGLVNQVINDRDIVKSQTQDEPALPSSDTIKTRFIDRESTKLLFRKD